MRLVIVLAAALIASLFAGVGTAGVVWTCNGEEATIVGTTRRDLIRGTPGRDVIVARSGYDSIEGKGGADVICAGWGVDWIDPGAGDDWANGQRGVDTFVDGFGDDRYHGSWGIDSFIATARIWFANGDPPLVLSGGADWFFGGEGLDHFSDSSDESIEVNLEQGRARGDVIGSDNLRSVERVAAGDGDDLLIGSAAANELSGGNGDDHVEGRGGEDWLMGSFGDDFLDGGDGFDHCHAGGPGTSEPGDVVVSCEDLFGD